MFRVLKASSLLLATSIVSGCISQPAAIVSAPLQPAANEPTTYLVGAIGPQYLGGGGAATNLRLLIRKRGSINGAAALWEGDPRPTPEDIHEPRAAGSVFVMPLKPGDYEFYNFQFWSMVYTPGLGSRLQSQEAREEFVLPLRLEAGKAYYIGEFRSVCSQVTQCFFAWSNQMPRDAVIAQRQVPGLPDLQWMPLDLDKAKPFILPVDKQTSPANATAEIHP
ncbi:MULTISPECIES: hypothetical protein [Pseudomonas]|uniref:hypothetical protein n=1 Tax=Pseudomonas TaxID=286 RepID=UPI000D959376|nr:MULTISPECIES: hypothetical protein [Pseudomonas]NMY72084.1 hypothetical protein [Pseudomonas sp. WS 5414]PYC03616.1 hypothetical protein DMX09_15815 [Pseudomonas protegens]